MSGLLRRLTRRGPATADENRSPAIESSDPAATPADTPAEPGGDRPVGDDQATQLLPATGEQTVVQPAGAEAEPAPEAQPAADAEATPTAFAAQPVPARDLPAGVDPADLGAITPASARRGKLRRRLRYLRHVRLLLLRDLGGFTYEIHRSAGGTAQESHRKLAEAKAERITAIDAEVASLEGRLGEPHAGTVLREPGIGGTCPACGELHASDAHYCSRCGEPLDEKARARRDAAIAAVAVPAPQQPVAEAPPASVLWAGATKQAEPGEPEPDQPAAITSEWLGTGAGQPTTFDRPEPEPVNPWVATSERASAAAEAAATTPDEPPTETAAAPDEPATTPGEPPTEATPPDEPTAAEPVVPKPKRKPRKPKPAPAPEPETRAFEPNGRRDEDVPTPEPDPAFPPREQS